MAKVQLFLNYNKLLVENFMHKLMMEKLKRKVILILELENQDILHCMLMKQK